MKIIIHASKDEMILAARTAQTAMGRASRGELRPAGTGVIEFENGLLFTYRRNRDSITVWSQQATERGEG